MRSAPSARHRSRRCRSRPSACSQRCARRKAPRLTRQDDGARRRPYNARGGNAAMNKNWKNEQVLIVGGGIGGLTAALALERQGIPSQVIEQATEFKEIGAGIQLGPNAFWMLDVGLPSPTTICRIVDHKPSAPMSAAP